MTARLLDLFCCEGIGGSGYAAAGFDVTGVDIDADALSRNPFRTFLADALKFVAEHGTEYDAIHASPPCQAHTTMSNKHRGKGTKADEWPDLIAPTRAALIATGRPWVLENVAGARRQMLNPVTLHGGMFGLQVDRPRLFDSNILILKPPDAPRAVDPIGVYGNAPDGRRLFTRADGSNQYAAKSLEQARALMDAPWASWRGCAEAIPPAYTEFIGNQLIEHLAVAA